MAKTFSGIMSLIFIAVGGISILLPLPQMHSLQGPIYLGVGVLGLLAWWRNYGIGFSKWLGAGCLLVSALVFTGLQNILGLVEFHPLSKWPYLIVGLISLWVSFSSKPKENKFVNEV